MPRYGMYRGEINTLSPCPKDQEESRWRPDPRYDESREKLLKIQEEMRKPKPKPKPGERLVQLKEGLGYCQIQHIYSRNHDYMNRSRLSIRIWHVVNHDESCLPSGRCVAHIRHEMKTCLKPIAKQLEKSRDPSVKKLAEKVREMLKNESVWRYSHLQDYFLSADKGTVTEQLRKDLGPTFVALSKHSDPNIRKIGRKLQHHCCAKHLNSFEKRLAAIRMQNPETFTHRRVESAERDRRNPPISQEGFRTLEAGMVFFGG